MIRALKITNVFEHKEIIDVDLFADFVTPGIGAYLLHSQTLLDQKQCIVY